jgi:hypothetical protein
MEASQRRKTDKFQREDNFMKDNAADFPADSAGDKTAKEAAGLTGLIENLAARQISGADDSRQHTSVKADLMDDLNETIRNLNRAANAFGDEVAGAEMKFRLPRNRSGQNLLATAKSFAADAEPLKAKFVEYGLDADFLADFRELINEIETRESQADTADDTRAEATGGLLDNIQKRAALSRKLDSIVKIKYRANPAKLAAWAVASHLERDPQPKAKDENKV